MTVKELKEWLELNHIPGNTTILVETPEEELGILDITRDKLRNIITITLEEVD